MSDPQRCGARLATGFALRATVDDETVVLLNGIADLLSVIRLVGVALGPSLLPEVAAWPLTGFGTTTVFLRFGGVDVLIDRVLARHM